MLSVESQIESGKLVCPQTLQRLIVQENLLVTADHKIQYPLIRGVPILIDQERQGEYLSENSGSMEQEYNATNAPASGLRRLLRRTLRAGNDYRSQASAEAFRQTVEGQADNALCIAVGGGPLRHHEKLVNLNIGLFENVDIVADAYKLPYADGVVDAVFCEAVLEHLEFPETAVKEMYRVLKPGGQIFAATPFLQMYHGYPNHFQNFTLTGHERLFTRNGFELISSGVCVGPTFVITDLLAAYIKFFRLPKLVKTSLLKTMAVLFAAMRPLDKKMNASPHASDFASTTYVHVKKAAVV